MSISDLLAADGYMVGRDGDPRAIVWLGDTYVGDKRTPQAVVLAGECGFHAGFVYGDCFRMMFDRFGSVDLAAKCATTFMLEKCATVNADGDYA